MIEISPTAASKITELLAEENKEGSGLRVFVQGGGLLGLPVRADDRGGGHRRAIRCSNRTASSCTSTRSASAISAAPKWTFVDTVTGGGFTIKNPNAVSTCGCGQSFSRANAVGGDRRRVVSLQAGASLRSRAASPA